MAHPCPDCDKAFKHAQSLRKHRTIHRDGAGLLPCPHCSNLLKTKDSLRQHVKTEHDDRYAHRCPVCNKGFQSRCKLTKHHLAHGADDPAAQRKACAVLGRECVRLLERQLQGSGTSQEQALAGPTVACALCGVRAPRSDLGLFPCARCSKQCHWMCAGLSGPPPRALPPPPCPACLRLEGASPAAVAVAQLNRAMAEAYAAERGMRVVPVEADGWCLLRCVAKATGVDDPAALIEPAAAAVVVGLDLGILDDATRADVLSEAERLRARPDAAGRRIHALWDSALCHVMPRALSRATSRPLHIVSGDARSGRVTVTVVDEGGVQSPVTLLRSGDEYGAPHYDLVEAA
jgi:uncharacterized C2H2 Zn-finger protein